MRWIYDPNESAKYRRVRACPLPREASHKGLSSLYQKVYLPPCLGLIRPMLLPETTDGLINLGPGSILKGIDDPKIFLDFQNYFLIDTISEDGQNMGKNR
jgi:hypothetical protein